MKNRKRKTKPARKARPQKTKAAKAITVAVSAEALIASYLAHGFALVPIPRGQKRPIARGWNKPENLIYTPEQAAERLNGGNIGAHLAMSHIDSVDLDDLAQATIALAAVGIDAAEVIAAGWQVVSGRPNKAHSNFAAHGDARGHKTLRRLQRDEKGEVMRGKLGHPLYVVVLELRGDSPNLQNVLPPSIHPDTGQPYTAKPLPEKLPPLPEKILSLWRCWDELEAKMLEAIGENPADAPRLAHSTSTSPSTGTSSGRPLRYPSPKRVYFNDMHAVSDILANHGYTQHGARWAHPSATGSPGVRLIPGKKDLWQSDNQADPLLGTFDAWTAYVILNHEGDPASAEASFKTPAVPETRVAEVEARETARRVGEGDTSPNTARVLTLNQMLAEYVYVHHGKVVCERARPQAALTFDEFMAAYAASIEWFEKPAKKADTPPTRKPYPVSKLWLGDERRLSTHTLTFHPGAPEFTLDPKGNPALNLWRARPITGVPQYWEECARPFFDHVEFLIPDPAQASRFLDWCAHAEQQPGEKVNHGWLMLTDEKQGIGRNWVSYALAHVWAGQSAVDFDIIRAIRDNFMGRLSCKIFACLNEIMAGQIKDRYTFAERLKNFVTDTEIEINPKFGRRHMEFFNVRWLFLSNHIAAMPLSDEDNRFEVVRNPDAPKDKPYYRGLYARLPKNDQPSLAADQFIASVRQSLATRDLSGFVAGDRAQPSAAKSLVVEATRSELDTALLELREVWPGELVRASVVALWVKRHTGTEEARGITYAYRRCGFVALGRKIRTRSLHENIKTDPADEKHCKVERVFALRDAEAWEQVRRVQGAAHIAEILRNIEDEVIEAGNERVRKTVNPARLDGEFRLRLGLEELQARLE